MPSICWPAGRSRQADRFLLALPLFHVHGLGNGLHCWLISGCRMRLLERFEHQTAAATLLDFRPTLFFGVPTVYVRLLGLDPAMPARSAPSCASSSRARRRCLRRCWRISALLFGHTILERYGMSETLMIMSNPYAGERRAGTVGFALPGISVRLLNAALEPVAFGETGEVYLRGPNVFEGYWRREAGHPRRFRQRLVPHRRSGHPLTRRLLHADRTQERSDHFGRLQHLPARDRGVPPGTAEVAEAAVIAVPDRVRGEVPVAYVVASGSFDAAAVEARCRQKLASFKIPRDFVVVDKLPRNAMGKIQKHLLPGRT